MQYNTGLLNDYLCTVPDVEDGHWHFCAPHHRLPSFHLAMRTECRFAPAKAEVQYPTNVRNGERCEKIEQHFLLHSSNK